MRDDNVSDLLSGVAAIGEYLNIVPRRVYHLAAEHGLPTFKIGKTLCARKVSLDSWVRSKEAASLAKARSDG